MDEHDQIPTSKKVTAAISWSVPGKVFYFFLKFFESVLLIRLLGSEQFGIYGSLINFLGIITLFLSLGFDSILNKYFPLLKIERRFDDIRSLLRLALIARFVFFVSIACALLLSTNTFAGILFHNLTTGVYFGPILVVLAFSLFYSLFRIIIDSSYHLKYLSSIDIAAQLLFLIIASVCVLKGFGLLGVLYALVFSQAVLFILLFIKFRSVLLRLPQDGAHVDFNAKSFFAYGMTMYLYAILTFLLGKGLDVLLLDIMLGDMTQIAYYIIAFNLAWYSTGLLEMAISGSYVMSLIVENHVQKNHTNLRQIYSGLFELNYILIIPVVLGGILLRNEIIQVLFSSKHAAAAPYFAVFLITLGVSRYTSITQTFLVIINGEKKLLLSRFIVGMLNVLFAFLFIPRFGAMGMAFATGISILLSVLFESILLHKIMQLPNCWSFIRKTFAASIVMMVPLTIGYLVIPLSSLASLLLLISIAVIIYLVLLTRFKPISAENIDFVARGNPRLGKLLRRWM
jgi:O-antigen/teichoic acid export membrane protein